jgi:SH3-like domain-containing protein
MKKLTIFFIIMLQSSLCFAYKSQLQKFVSIKSDEVNARKGPGVNYEIVNVYEYKWLPVEIIGEYDTWKKIKDPDGDEGWIHTSILSNKRHVYIKAKSAKQMHKSDSNSSRIIANLMPGLICQLKKCKGIWCKVSCKGKTGWTKREFLWGINSDEEI